MMDVPIARKSRLGRSNAKLLFLNKNFVEHYKMRELPDLLPENCLMVVNSAATLPASFQGNVGSLPVELRLVANQNRSTADIRFWEALVFYRGNWKQKTEDRMDPDFLEIGDRIEIGDLVAKIISIPHSSKRWVGIEFMGTLNHIWQSIYRYGDPIQYSHLNEKLNLWDVQTVFSSIPVGVEPPSAAFQFSWGLVNELVSRGFEVVDITHATSISSTGIEELDALLPFPEHYWITSESADMINKAIEERRPIIAIGTSVTRALEDNFNRFHSIQSGNYTTNLVLDAAYHPRLVTGLFTGMHLPEESHYQLLQSFISKDILEIAYEESIDSGYLFHEYGDVSLIIP